MVNCSNVSTSTGLRTRGIGRRVVFSSYGINTTMRERMLRMVGVIWDTTITSTDS